ncbi:MAG: YbaN family protein [Spirochaetota bacterium]
MTRARRYFYAGLGILLTAIGVIGIVTPVLPTTIFLILASGLFLKASPALHERLHRSPVTGPYLRAYTEGNGLSLRRKLTTIALLWLTLLVSAWFVRERIWLLILLAAVGVGVTIHIATIRPRGAREADPGADSSIR